MTVQRITIILFLILSIAACGKKEEKADEHGDEHTTTTAAEAHAEGEEEGPETVTLDAAKLAALSLTTAPATMKAVDAGVTMPAQMTVNESAYAEVASPISAQVLRLAAGAGNSVRRGQTLADLQSAELGRARAEYLSAKARAELAHRTLERKRGLAADRVVAPREVQEAEANAASADADVRAAAAALRALGVSGGDSESPTFALRAPIAGTILERHAAVGQVVDPSTALFKIADLSRLWLVAQASERDAGRIAAGTAVRVTFPAVSDEQFEGRVTLVGRQVDPATRTVPVRIEVRNERGALRPGMTASVSVPTGTTGPQVLTIPVEALQRLEDAWHVFIPRTGGVFEQRRVERGRTIGSEAEVTSGLNAGEVVVVKGAFVLKAEAEKAGGEAGHHDH